MGKCNICGTRTGIHGFSFDSTLNQPKATAGILMIPEGIIPSDQTEDEFVSMILEHMSRSPVVSPEIKIVKKK